MEVMMKISGKFPFHTAGLKYIKILENTLVVATFVEKINMTANCRGPNSQGGRSTSTRGLILCSTFKFHYIC